MDAEALDAVDMEDMPPGQFADWTGEDFAADGSGGFFAVSTYTDEFPRDGRGFEPSMLVSSTPESVLRAYFEWRAGQSALDV